MKLVQHSALLNSRQVKCLPAQLYQPVCQSDTTRQTGNLAFIDNQRVTKNNAYEKKRE